MMFDRLVHIELCEQNDKSFEAQIVNWMWKWRLNVADSGGGDGNGELHVKWIYDGNRNWQQSGAQVVCEL